MRQSVDYEADYGHVDTHAQQVIGNLHKGTGCYGGINMYLLKQQRKQSTPERSYQYQGEHTAWDSICKRIRPAERECIVCQHQE